MFYAFLQVWFRPLALCWPSCLPLHLRSASPATRTPSSRCCDRRRRWRHTSSRSRWRGWSRTRLPDLIDWRPSSCSRSATRISSITWRRSGSSLSGSFSPEWVKVPWSHIRSLKMPRRGSSVGWASFKRSWPGHGATLLTWVRITAVA